MVQTLWCIGAQVAAPPLVSQGYKRFWVSSGSPGLSAKISFYGIYYYNDGQVKIWPYPSGRKEHTVNVLERIRQEKPDREIDIIWDGASWHTARLVQEAGKRLNMNIFIQPGFYASRGSLALVA